MKEKKFNLLEEPWIKVLSQDMDVEEVSLMELFTRAHEFRQLAGETAAQDAAIYRFLLAILMTVFYRYKCDGTEDLLSENAGSDANDVLQRWIDYWNQGFFTESVFKAYLEKYGERFWLFHPETPFYQVADLQYGTDYQVYCMIGNIKESNNSATKHHFSMAEGEKITKLSYSEAARWLLFFNAYAVNVKQDKKAPGTNNAVGVGIMGKLGYIMLQRNTLFETLMLNLCALRDGETIWDEPNPIWEQKVHTLQGQEIVVPNNIPEAFSVQSRRIMLREDQGYVTGLRVMGGDYYSLENQVQEQMTIWKCFVDKKTKKKTESPKKHNSSVHIWREFSSITSGDDGGDEKARIPGLIRWMTLLTDNVFDMNEVISIRSVGFDYGDGMSYTYGDCFSDCLALSAGLLNDLGEIWRARISDEIQNCKKVGTIIKSFTDTVGSIYGQDPKSKSAINDKLNQRFYFEIDGAFREWLLSINVCDDDMDTKMKQWERKAYFAARKVVDDYLISLGDTIYRLKEDDKKRILSVPGAYNLYLAKLNSVYEKTIENDNQN